jgi:hypothetical protein
LCVLPSGLWRIGLWLSLLPEMHRVGYYDVSGGVYILALSLVSETLALLTLGLVRPWGEVLPARVPLLGGRRLPARLVVGIAGTGVALLALVYAYAFLNAYVWHVHFDEAVGSSGQLHETVPDGGPWFWLMAAAYAPLLAWAPLLGAVTWAYARRRGVARGANLEGQ